MTSEKKSLAFWKTIKHLNIEQGFLQVFKNKKRIEVKIQFIRRKLQQIKTETSHLRLSLHPEILFSKEK